MDILAHGVYNIALQKSIKNKKKTKKEIFVAFLWGVLPDFVAFAPSFLLAFFGSSFSSFDHHALVAGFDIARSIYPFTHSLVIFLAVFFIVFIFIRKFYWPMFGWGLHILVDMPLHTPEFFPTPFLFPLSDWTLPFGIAWSTPYIWASFWVAAFIWLGYLWYKRRKNKNLEKISEDQKSSQ